MARTRPSATRRSARKQSQASRFERLEPKLALASDGPLLGATPAAPLLPKIHVSHFGQDISFVATTGPVKGATVTNGGSGYTSVPQVTINANSSGGTGATAIAVLGSGDQAGTVVGITITNPGSGYSGAASITIAGPGGSGSAAAASLVVDLSNRQMFQDWASDYIQFITNSGASVAYINVGDYKTDNKHAYDYLRPELGDDGVPWIVTDFLDKLPQGVAAGTIAYLDVANPWHLYDPPENPAGSNLPPPNRNFAGNTFTTDGKPTSPPMNNMYQSFLLVNQINAAVLKHTPANGAPRKFITHYEADGEGAGAFETDTYYGFGGAPANAAEPYTPSKNSAVPGGSWAWDVGTRTASPAGAWPVAGYGYSKLLWNRFMPGATDVFDDGISVPLPAGGDVPDVVFTDAEAMSIDTWSHGEESPYQFGIIKYAQTSWLKYSPGPMIAYTENYWFGENHYMPGAGSSIAPDTTATINYVSTPVLNAPKTANDFSATPTVTFNQPVDASGNPIGTPAMGYVVMGTGGIDQTAYGNGTAGFFTNNGVGNGYSTGVWISTGKGGSGYTVGSKDNLNVSFKAQPGDPSKYPGQGFIDTVDSNGGIVSITITDPGDYKMEPSIVLPATAGTVAEPEVYLTQANGYPVAVFPEAPAGGTTPVGFVTVSSQGTLTAGKPGQIMGLHMRDWGSGYSQTPNTSVQFAPITEFDGNGGLAQATLTIIDPGSGYTAAPDISIYKPQGGIGPTLDVVMNGDKVGSVKVTSPGSGYSTANPPTIMVQPKQPSGYDSIPSGPLAGPGGLPVTFDTTVNGTYNWSPVISQYRAGYNTPLRVPTLYAPINASSRQVAQIVITVVGDHYDTAANKPYYTLSGDPSQTKHYLTGGSNGNGIDPYYNGAYVPVLDSSGGFPVDSSGRSSISIIDCGMGYSAGAVIDNAGAGYDNQTVYNVAFPAPKAGGTAAEGLLLVNSDGAVTGIVVTSAGSGYTSADDGQTITLQNPGTDGTAATAKIYLSNYPTVTITSDTTADHTPARPYVITGPTDPKNPQLSDPSKGYIVTGIGFTYPGVGYQKSDTFTFGFSEAAAGGKKPVAAALPALGTKFSANELPVLAVTDPASATQIQGGANAFNWQISNGYGPGQVSKITNLAGGSGYTSAPAVTFPAPPLGGKMATAHAVVSGGVVTQIVIDDNGYGYDPSQPLAVTIAAPGGTGTQATATVVLGDVQVLSMAALHTVYANYASRPDLLAEMFDDELYQDVALPKLREEFYWPLVWTDFTNPNSTDGSQVPQQAIATFSIESMNRSNTFKADGTYDPTQITRTCLDAKYQSDANLSVPNTLGGTFSGLSSLTYAQFVDFLNSAATIIAKKAGPMPDGSTMQPQDVTFQVYDAAFLPLEWITQTNPNRWGAVNEAPVFHSPATGTVTENGPLPIYTPLVSDIGATVADRTLTYTLKPGVGDVASLAIDSRTGIVSLLSPANYEAKKTYQFVIVATDGGTPAFSVEKAITVDVVDVFEVPAPPAVAVPAEFPVVEDIRSPLVFSALPFADADTPAAAAMSVVLRVPEGAVIARSGAGVVVSGTGTARVFTGTLADLNAYFTTVPARITYQSAANRNGRVPLTVTMSETTSQYAHETTATSELVIAAVNDAPQASGPAAFRVTEDVASNLVWRGPAGPVADVDSASVQVTLGVTAGQLAAAPAPAAVVVAGIGSQLTLTGAPADINAFLRQPGSIRYTTAPDSTATQQLVLTVVDGQGGQAIARSRIVVRAVNDAPVVAAFATLSGAVQQMPLVIDRKQLFAATGAADADSRRTVFVVDQVNAGTVQRWNGSSWVAITAKTPLAGRLVTAADKLRWTPPAGAGTSTQAFTVRAWDGRAFSTVASQVVVRATVV